MPRKALRGESARAGGFVGRDRRLGMSNKYWNSLPWRPVDVDVDAINGDFDDSVFHGLEEIDGNLFLSQKAAKETAVPESEPCPVEKTTKKSKKDKKRAREEDNTTAATTDAVAEETDKNTQSIAAESEKNKKKKSKKATAESLKPAEPATDTANKKTNKKNKRNAAATTAGAADEPQKVKETKKEFDHAAMAEVLSARAVWGDISLSAPLAEALAALDFSSPTPIQRQAVPVVGEGKCDVVGVAETGSGKTLAYLLPVLNALLLDWNSSHTRQSPYALIVAPTRELAMQISHVLRDVSLKLRTLNPALSFLKIESATVVGGMSEEKQRRQLTVSDKKALHVLVATPGRLCELLEDNTITALRDLSQLRFLVVDEADRIMEEGHFSELNRVFSRIRDHEEIASSGRSVDEVLRERERGVDVDELAEREGDEEQGEELDEDEEDEGDEHRGVPGFDRMPTEEELQRARALQPAVPYDEDGEGEEDEGEEGGDEEQDEEEEEEDMQQDVVEDEDNDEEAEGLQNEGDDDEEEEINSQYASDEELRSPPAPAAAAPQRENQRQNGKRGKKSKRANYNASGVCTRQTLLFSATALQTLEQNERKQTRKQSKAKLNGTLKGLATGCSLPGTLKELLALVAVQNMIHVVDVTHDSHGSLLHECETSTDRAKEMVVALPRNLKQFEILCPTEDKDVYAYYFLYKNPGRTLVFVNSIKTARRVDGLLRALGFHSRALHAELAQRARLQALDSFRSSPQSILVATDVAARGLDIPQISAVLHYDVARSPQVYMHRSGRTARAHASGTAVSLVTPEDAAHHQTICVHLAGQAKALDALRVDLQILPPLRERVKLAKKIFTASFVVSQRSRERHWVQQSAEEAGLEMDDGLRDELGADEDQRQQEKVAQAKLQKERAALKALLDIPVEGNGAVNMGGDPRNREKPFKHNKKSKKLAAQQQIQQQDWRKRRNGFFVYTPPN